MIFDTHIHWDDERFDEDRAAVGEPADPLQLGADAVNQNLFHLLPRLNGMIQPPAMGTVDRIP